MRFKKLSIALISSLLIASLLLGGTAYAQDEEDLPDPGITPDSPFYFFDDMGKRIGMFLAFGPEAKARKALEYAEERLAEARAMANKNRTREMTRAANDYDGFMAMVNERAEEARQRGASDNLSERVASATSKHLSVLDRIKDTAPEQAREALNRAREASQNGQINALRALARTKPERAIDISSAAIERRLERARVKATENMTADAEEALDYAAVIAELEEELVATAQEKGIDITAKKRLAQSTSNRLEALTRVQERVPEQARPAIENAIENSVRKYERTIERIQEQNVLGEISEEAPALQRVLEQVRERLQLRTSNQLRVSENASANATEPERIRVEAQERVQERVIEQTSDLESETPERTTSENQTVESTEADTPGKRQGQRP